VSGVTYTYEENDDQTVTSGDVGPAAAVLDASLFAYGATYHGKE